MLRAISILFSCLFLIVESSFSQNRLIPITNGRLWGYCDEKMKMIIPFQYDNAYPFFEDRALVIKYKYEVPEGESFIKAAFIDPTGKVAFELNSTPQASPASRFHEGVAVVENYNQPIYDGSSSISVVDKNGKELQKIKDAVLDFDLSMYHENGIAFNEYGIYATPNLSNGSIILVFRDGREAIRTNYAAISKFHKGLAVVMEAYNTDTNEYAFALIDTTGAEVIASGKFELIYDFYNGNVASDGLICFRQDEKYGYVNISGEVVMESIFDFAGPFSEGMAVVGQLYEVESEYGPDRYYKYGFIDTKGKLVIDYQYDCASPFSEGFAEVVSVQLEKKLLTISFIDKTGKASMASESIGNEINYPNYPFDAYVYKHGFYNETAILYKKGLVGFINKKGEKFIPPLYFGLSRVGPSMIVEHFDNGITRVMHPDVYNYSEMYIDTTGKQYYIPPKMIFPSLQKTVRTYSAPDEDKVLDTLRGVVPFVVASIANKKAKRKGQKGQWIALDNYEGEIYYVFSTDVNTNSLLTITHPSSKIFAYPDAGSEMIGELLPNSVLFLHEQAKIKDVGTAKWLRVYYYNAYDYENALKIGYIKGTDIKKQ